MLPGCMCMCAYMLLSCMGMCMHCMHDINAKKARLDSDEYIPPSWDTDEYVPQEQCKKLSGNEDEDDLR